MAQVLELVLVLALALVLVLVLVQVLLLLHQVQVQALKQVHMPGPMQGLELVLDQVETKEEEQVPGQAKAAVRALVLAGEAAQALVKAMAKAMAMVRVMAKAVAIETTHNTIWSS